MYTFNIIWFLDKNIIDKKAVLVMILFDNLLNNFNSTYEVSFIKILYFSVNIILIK